MSMKPKRLADLIRCAPRSSMIRSLRKSVKKDFEISRVRYRTRYFTDSGIIGSKEFVAENYQRFKHLFYSKHEKKPQTDQRPGGDVFVEAAV